MSHVEVLPVSPEEWRANVTGRLGDGYRWLDFLTVIDRGATLDVLVRLVDPGTCAAVLLTTTIPTASPDLTTIADVVPGADWYEREAAEMFGVAFNGRRETRPLLTRPGSVAPPLLKSTSLPARLEVPWPGADPDAVGSRRRTQPPGVLDTWVAP